MRNPCYSCERLHATKNDPQCYCCRRRTDYLSSIEPAPACTQDPVYALSYRLPRGIGRSMGPLPPLSQQELPLRLF
jgi:hypothetical protein